MKIGVVGCGALGSYYGARLQQAGHQTHFLLRSDYQAVQDKGVLVHSPSGEFRVFPHAADDPEEIGICDLVVIGLKTTANDQFKKLLKPLVGSKTWILTLQNGLGNEEALAEIFPEEQIFGGLCFVCINRLEPGVINHIAHGKVVLGEYNRPSGERAKSLAAIFEAAQNKCEVAENLAQAHWEKLVWNVPFNGLGVAGSVGLEAFEEDDEREVYEPKVDPKTGQPKGINTEELLASELGETLVRELMHEVITTAITLGYSVDPELAEQQIERTRGIMGPYRASTVVDFEAGRPLEVEALFGEPLRQAKQAGVQTPRLQRLYAITQALQVAQDKKK